MKQSTTERGHCDLTSVNVVVCHLEASRVARSRSAPRQQEWFQLVAWYSTLWYSTLRRSARERVRERGVPGSWVASWRPGPMSFAPRPGCASAAQRPLGRRSRSPEGHRRSRGRMGQEAATQLPAVPCLSSEGAGAGGKGRGSRRDRGRGKRGHNEAKQLPAKPRLCHCSPASRDASSCQRSVVECKNKPRQRGIRSAWRPRGQASSSPAQGPHRGGGPWPVGRAGRAPLHCPPPPAQRRPSHSCLALRTTWPAPLHCHCCPTCHLPRLPPGTCLRRCTPAWRLRCRCPRSQICTSQSHGSSCMRSWNPHASPLPLSLPLPHATLPLPRPCLPRCLSRTPSLPPPGPSHRPRRQTWGGCAEPKGRWQTWRPWLPQTPEGPTASATTAPGVYRSTGVRGRYLRQA